MTHGKRKRETHYQSAGEPASTAEARRVLAEVGIDATGQDPRIVELAAVTVLRRAHRELQALLGEDAA